MDRLHAQTSINLLDSLESFLSTFRKDLSAVSGQISELQDRSKDIDSRLKSRRVSLLLYWSNSILGPEKNDPANRETTLQPTFRRHYPSSACFPHSRLRCWRTMDTGHRRLRTTDRHFKFAFTSEGCSGLGGSCRGIKDSGVYMFTASCRA